MSSLTDAVQGKKCSKCRQFKPFESFGLNRTRRDGLQGVCKVCDRENNRNWYLNNPEKGMLKEARTRALKAGIPCTITVEDIIIPEHCPILGLKLERGTGHLSPTSPSLDRIVPELGYVPGNVVVISMKANRMKADHTLESLENLVNWLKAQKAAITTNEDMSTC